MVGLKKIMISFNGQRLQLQIIHYTFNGQPIVQIHV